MLRAITKFPLARVLGSAALYSSKVESGLSQVLKDNTPPKQVRLLPRSKYGGEHIVTLLTGSTILGKQGAHFIRSLFETAKVPVFFERLAVGGSSEAPLDFLMSVARNRAAIYVDIQHDPRDKHKSLLLASDLDLYACVIKMHSFSGFQCRHPGLDIMMVLQNNSGDYTKLEYEPVRGLVETLKITQRESVERFLRFTFREAAKNCRRKITVTHQAHELPKTDGMFLEVASELQRAEFPRIQLEFMSVKTAVRYLVMKPQIFDVICAGDRYGTFIASIASAVCGGTGLFSSAELSDHHAVFKPLQTRLSMTHSKLLSPYGVVRACIELLLYLGNEECAQVLWQELLRAMLVDKIRTAEFGGSDDGEFVICNIVNKLKCRFQ